MTAGETEMKKLMVASLAGDAGAYRKLLDQVSRYLRGYYRTKLSRYRRGATEAEDLVQDVLMAIHTRRHTYNPEEPFTPWMHAIAQYKFIDHLRRTRSSLSNVPIDDADEITALDDRISYQGGKQL